MANIDIDKGSEMGADDLEQVKGGGLLLPAVQKVRESATTAGGGGGQWIGDVSVSNTR